MHAVLDDLVQARAELAPWQRPEQRRIDDDQAGGWNAPIRFLPSGWLTPTLPPIALSTCASSVVGTCTSVTPRRYVAAAKPAASPMTPPPTAMTTDCAIRIGADERLVDARHGRELLVALAVGHQNRPSRRQRIRDVRPWSFQTTGDETTKSVRPA